MLLRAPSLLQAAILTSGSVLWLFLIPVLSMLCMDFVAIPLMTSLFPLQPLPRGGSSGHTVSGFLGSALRLPGFQQGAQVPPGDVSLRSSFLSPAFRRASPPRLSEYGHLSLLHEGPAPGMDPHTMEQGKCLCRNRFSCSWDCFMCL